MVTQNSCDYQPTQYNVQTGGASGTLNNVAPSATSGVPVISQGSSAQPIFGTAVVAGGGTGITSTTAYAPIIGGTTSTGAFQSASTGLGNSGYILVSNGSSAAPSFNSPGSVGASLVLIQTQSVGTVASILFNTNTSNYKYFLFSFLAISPVTSGAQFQMQILRSGVVQTTAYSTCTNVQFYTSSLITTYSSTSSHIISGPQAAGGNQLQGFLWFAAANSGVNGMATGSVQYIDPSSNYQNAYFNGLSGNLAISAFQFSYTTGNINDATISCYGLVS